MREEMLAIGVDVGRLFRRKMERANRLEIVVQRPKLRARAVEPSNVVARGLRLFRQLRHRLCKRIARLHPHERQRKQRREEVAAVHVLGGLLAVLAAMPASADYLLSGYVAYDTIPSVYLGDAVGLYVSEQIPPVNHNGGGYYGMDGVILTIQRPPIAPLVYACTSALVSVANGSPDELVASGSACVDMTHGIVRPEALVGVVLTDPTGAAFDSVALPDALDVADFYDRWISLGDGPLAVLAWITDAVAIPEPDGLGVVALLALFALRRRHAALGRAVRRSSSE